MIAFVAICAWAFLLVAIALSIRLAVPPLVDARERLRTPTPHAVASEQPQRRCARLERHPVREETGGRTA